MTDLRERAREQLRKQWPEACANGDGWFVELVNEWEAVLVATHNETVEKCAELADAHREALPPLAKCSWNGACDYMAKAIRALTLPRGEK